MLLSFKNVVNHTHFLLILGEQSNAKTEEAIDRIVSVETPDERYPELRKRVLKNMFHTLCGVILLHHVWITVIVARNSLEFQKVQYSEVFALKEVQNVFPIHVMSCGPIGLLFPPVGFGVKTFDT